MRNSICVADYKRAKTQDMIVILSSSNTAEITDESRRDAKSCVSTKSTYDTFAILPSSNTFGVMDESRNDRCLLGRRANFALITPPMEESITVSTLFQHQNGKNHDLHDNILHSN